MHRASILLAPLLAAALLLDAPAAHAQSDFREEEILSSDRPEAWAMSYLTSTTLMTSFGAMPVLASGEWNVAAELTQIPRLDASQRQVGFNGFKTEDLNKSPVFGRVRASVGLPAGWVIELGYTPPVRIDGLHTRDLFAAAVGRRLVSRERFSLSARVHGQHGVAIGDVTCPSNLAGDPDPERNPYGCQRASRDHIRLDYYGADLTTAWTRAAWQWHATLGVARMEPQVQVDAITFDIHDRSHLVARDTLPYLTLGVSRNVGERWLLGAEILHVPLQVRRADGASRENDSLTSLRLRLAYRH
ncbi:hypothetical protein [Lysobacter fragariae]